MSAVDVATRAFRHARDRVEDVAGGRRRAHVIVVLGAVLALQSADTATVGAAGPQLEKALGIGRPQIGLLLAVSSLVGAIATVPAGVLVDRRDRTRLLAIGVALWGVASAVSGLATSFVFLLLARVALGVVVAIAAPAVASLLGDYFPVRDRARIYGYVLTGELVGTGFGFIVAGDLAAVSWRAAFFALVPPAIALAYAVHRLPEPKRRSESGYDVGDLRKAVVHVLRVRSNVVLIVCSALGYFFFAGVRGFGIEFVRRQYGLAQTAATALVPVIGAGMLVGILSSGRLADRLRRNGHATARVSVAAGSAFVAAAVFVPALLSTTVVVALPLLAVAAAAMAAANPPLDAARLDVMPPRLWGRAEAIRTLLQSGAQAAAPLLFGFLASDAFGHRSGLQDTFLVSLVPLAASAVLLATVGRRTYPKDAAAARR